VTATATPTQRPTLAEARSRLRELGYLDAGVDRLLFRPVFEGRGGAFLTAVVIGALAAALCAVAAVEAAEPGVSGSAATIAALFAHLFVASLLPAGLLALGLSVLAVRVRAPGVAATVAGMAAALLVFALWIGGTYSLDHQPSARALLWAIPIGVAAFFLAAAVRLGFLALAFARAGKLPRRILRRVFAGAAALGLLVAILLLFSRRGEPAVHPPQPSPRSVPVVVLAIDGLDLDGAGKGGEAAAILERGDAGWWPAEQRTPPEIWTTMATGVPAARHGVRALTRVRPAGAALALRPPWGTSWYLRRLGPLLGLVANAPVSHVDRRSLDFWEVAASAGIPSLSVGWWAAGPWPGATVVENRTVFARAGNGEEADVAAMALFEAERSKGFGLATVYLPGCDIAREDPERRKAAAGRIAGLLATYVERAARGEIILVVLAADSHPGKESLSRMVVFDGTPGGRKVRLRPEDAGPSILARLGVPVARDIEGRPVPGIFAPGSLETAALPSWGPRAAPAGSAAPETDEEYLEKLRSLGYLQ
jgi:hypothetical protein